MYFRDDATFSLTCQCIVCLKFTCRLRRIFPSEKELRERKHTRRRKQREGDSKKKERGSGGEERRGRAQGEGQECRLCLTVYSLNHQGVWAAADGPLSNVLMYGASLNNSGLSARSPAERKKKTHMRITLCTAGFHWLLLWKHMRVTEHSSFSRHV